MCLRLYFILCEVHIHTMHYVYLKFYIYKRGAERLKIQWTLITFIVNVQFVSKMIQKWNS